jgi:hypothetical protein
MDKTNSLFGFDDIDNLMKRLQEIKEEQKTLTDAEFFVKGLICSWLEEKALQKYDNEHCTVRLQARNKKDYGSELRAKEAELKELKKLKDDLGDYKVVSTETSLVYAAPKTPTVPSF